MQAITVKPARSGSTSLNTVREPSYIHRDNVEKVFSPQAVTGAGCCGRVPSARRGFMKILLDAKSDRILGFTMLGALPYSMLRDAILTHPTKAEGLNVLLAGVHAESSP